MELSGWDDANWWSGACEEDTAFSLDFEGEDGAWMSTGFLPPPPRPVFLEKTHSDGLTTCDLCTWATSSYSSHSSIGDNLASLPWPISLVIVSVISALVGATLMVTLRRCIKRLNTERVARLSEVHGERVGMDDGTTKESGVGRGGRGSGGGGGVGGGGVGRRLGGLWTLRTVGSAPSNHYTMDEALYAELDKPMYQNATSAPPPSSATPPSSAYYSDLSDRTYETVGGGNWEMSQRPLRVIKETATPIHHHHSDYV